MLDLDDNAPEGAVDFDWSAIDPAEVEPEQQPAAVEFNRRMVVCAVLSILTVGTNAKGAGLRAFVLAHALKAGTCRRKQDLARQLGISPGRVSQVLKSLRLAIHALSLDKTDPKHPED